MSAEVVAGIQARLGSTRLPRKVLADVAGAPLIARVVERVGACALVDRVVVLTSDHPRDAELAGELERRGIEHRRGPEDDVLARYTALVRETGCRHVVRVTGDSPLVEPSFVDLQLGALRAFDGDFVRIGNAAPGACDGTLGGQGTMSARALLAAEASDDPRDREHVGSFWFLRHRDRFRHVEVEVDPAYAWPGLRLCVDEAADLELVRRVFEAFPDGDFATLEALRWLRAHPEVARANADVRESDDNRACRRLAREAAEAAGSDRAIVGRYAG